MPILNCYVDERTLAILQRASVTTGRTVEQLAEAAFCSRAPPMTTAATLAGLSDLLKKARGLPLRQVDRERCHETATSGVETWSEAIADREGNGQFAHCADDDDCALLIAAVNALPALLARIAALESENAAAGRNVYRMQKLSAGLTEALEKIADSTSPSGKTSHWHEECQRIARAALTLKENDCAG